MIADEFLMKTQEIEAGIEFGAFHRADIMKEQHIYHYTTISAIKNIVESSCLWATEYRYLNDEDEFGFVGNILREVMDEEFGSNESEFTSFKLAIMENMIGELLKDYYVVSFSLNPDNLTLWAEFANPGCNFTVHPATLFKTVPYEISQVEYNRDEQKKIVREALLMVLRHFYPDKYQNDDVNLSEFLRGESDQYKKLIAYPCARLVALYGMSMKSSLFVAEEEYRAIFKCKSDTNIQYRVSGDRMIPYISAEINDKSFIKGVRLAPLNRSKLDVKSLDGFMRLHGMQDCRVETSKIKLRF